MIPDYWRPAEKFIGTCARCGEESLKRHMVSMYLKDGSYGQMKIVCHFCRRCAPDILDQLGVAMPD